MTGDLDAWLLDPGDRVAVRAAARLHRRTFPRYDSSRLGPSFCARLLRRYASSPDAWVVVIGERADPVGYLVAAPPPVQRAINRELAPWAAASSLRAPASVLRRLAARLRRPAAPSTPSPAVAPVVAPDEAASVRVVLVGADPRRRGEGIGAALLADFAERSASRGHRIADLSVELDNDAARRAYERAGWRWVGDEAGLAARYRLELAGSG